MGVESAGKKRRLVLYFYYPGQLTHNLSIGKNPPLWQQLPSASRPATLCRPIHFTLMESSPRLYDKEVVTFTDEEGSETAMHQPVQDVKQRRGRDLYGENSLLCFT